ncbi:hypothetical protein N9R79_01780 [Vibrio sp.]|nr:hypothetical protein [Vibrio sp.]
MNCSKTQNTSPYRDYLLYIAAIFCSLILLIPNIAYANLPILIEARKIVNVVPNKAKEITRNYLSISKLEKSDKGILIRNVDNTLLAYEILAQAEITLNNEKNLNNYIHQAISLTKQYQKWEDKLSFELIAIKYKTQNTDQLQKLLVHLQQSINDYLNHANVSELPLRLAIQTSLLEAEIQTALANKEAALAIYDELEEKIILADDHELALTLYLSFYQYHQQFNEPSQAFSILLLAYWKAVENNASAYLATLNTELAYFYLQHNLFDLASNHLSQAANYYEQFGKNHHLSNIFHEIGDIRLTQGKYNLSIIHYLNALDVAPTTSLPSHNELINKIDIYLSLASAYFILDNIEKSVSYLDSSTALWKSDLPSELHISKLHMQAKLALHFEQIDNAEQFSQKSIELSEKAQVSALEKEKLYALAAKIQLTSGKTDESIPYYLASNKLLKNQVSRVLTETQRILLAQKDFIESQLNKELKAHEIGVLKIESSFLKNVILILVLALSIFIIHFLYNWHINKKSNKAIQSLIHNVYVNPISGLLNFQFLLRRLDNSTYSKNTLAIEEEYFRDLIHEPLSDQLTFILLDFPFLRNTYVDLGYTKALELEKDFGQYLQEKLNTKDKLFHFSSTHILYVSEDTTKTASSIFNEFQLWLNQFHPELSLQRLFRISVIDYPFLPKSYLTMNEKEVVETLLNIAGVARKLSHKYHKSQWIYLKTKPHMPAALLATTEIRQALNQAIQQGFISIESSHADHNEIKAMFNISA